MMEMETPLPRHLHHLRHQGSSFIYLILGLVLLMPLIWQEYGSDEVRKWHPFFDVEYSFYWYLTISAMRIKPILYLTVAILARHRHRYLIYMFIVYESIMLVDHFLFYSQSNMELFGVQVGMRVITSVILAIYMVWHHYKYEGKTGWIG